MFIFNQFAYKFTPHEFSKFSSRKIRVGVQEIEEQRLILGLRSSEERSLLSVNEHPRSKRNDKVALFFGFF